MVATNFRKALCVLVIFALIMVVLQLHFTQFQFSLQLGWFSFVGQPLNTNEFINDSGGAVSVYRELTTVPLNVKTTAATVTTAVPISHINFTTVAIGMGITFRGSGGAKANLKEIPLMKTLVPSFCATASPGFIYHFYIAYDFNDPFLENAKNCDAFKNYLLQSLKTNCAHIKSDVHITKLSYSGKPAWAQNDAMMESYLDGIEYYYRINDDTVMKSKQWTEEFIKQLASYSPPNVGVTGPQHSGGNTAILTYDFTHRNHFMVFGYYYPRLMTDWYADRWITDVYKPGRSTKLSKIQLVHTMAPGTRYSVNPNVGSKVAETVAEGKTILQRYLKYSESSQSKSPPNNKNVISMSLYGSDPTFIYGAIRNAQLAPVIFPGWTLRIYMENPLEETKYPKVHERIVQRLQALGVQIKYINNKTRSAPPVVWSYIAGTDLTLDYFIVRNSKSRLTERDFRVVSEWVKTGKPFHCVRDHPSHTEYGLSGGLWGARPEGIQQIFNNSLENMLLSIHNESLIDVFLNETIWPLMKDHAYCHDSVSCNRYINSYPFPMERFGGEFIGQTFSAYGEPRKDEIDILLKSKLPSNCTTVK